MIKRNGIVWPTENWSASLPEEQGLNSKFLAIMDQYVQREDSKFRAILVIRHDKLVFERYYEGLEPRFGYLYLYSGQWKEQQLFSPEYHALATHQANAGGPPVEEAYGYLWWIITYLGYHT